MDLPNWVYIVGIVLVNVVLLLIICMIVFKTKDADAEIEKEIFNSSNEENENVKAMGEIYSAMAKANKKVSKVETFEQEQEENAIISFQELLKFKAEQEKIMAKDVEEKKPEEQKKFSNTEVISPIFGRMEKDEEEVESHELEKTLNIDPLKKEIKESEDFLNALKDFRKNL